MSTLRPFGLIGTTVWQSEKFTSLDKPDGRLAYLWLHTRAKTCAGIMRVGPAHLFEEVDFIEDLDRSADIFTELTEAKLIHWQRPYVVINKYLSHNPVKSYRHAIGVFREALAMPDCDAKTDLISELQRQSGSIDLAKWRDKSDQPHQVLFDIHSYLEEHTSPSETPSEPFSNPKGKIYKDNNNEKGEGRTLPEPPCSPSETPHQDKAWEMPRIDSETYGASQAAKRSALVQSDDFPDF